MTTDDDTCDEIPAGRPLRARKLPRHRLPEVEVYRLGEGMAAMLDAAAWIARRGNGYTVPYCDDSGLLMRSSTDDYQWNEWFGCGAILVWTPPGPDSGLHGEVGSGYLRDYDLIDPEAGA